MAISYRQPSAALFAGKECKQHIEIENWQSVYTLRKTVLEAHPVHHLD